MATKMPDPDNIYLSEVSGARPRGYRYDYWGRPHFKLHHAEHHARSAVDQKEAGRVFKLIQDQYGNRAWELVDEVGEFPGE